MYIKKRNTYVNWIVGTLVVVALGWLVHQLGPILTPFIAAAILAYILNPVVNQLTKRKISRTMASVLVTLLVIAVVIGMVLFIIPMMLKQFEAAWEKLPDMVQYVETVILPWINRLFGVSLTLDTQSMLSYLKQNAQQIRTGVAKIMPFVANQSGHLVLIVVNALLLPILLYYFLVDWPRWSQGMVNMIPRRYLERFSRIGCEIDVTLSEYLRGQLLVMVLVGLIYGGGLALVGLESGFAIGMIAGMLVIIPYLGAFIGLLLATMAALLQFGSVGGVLSVWAVFLVGQTLESYVITPRLVGERIGLSPLLVIFALMAFGQLMGFVGMLLALPLAAICLVLFRELMQNYYQSHYYRR